jgi:carbon-monoxide dehydrogenase medium subunit
MSITHEFAYVKPQSMAEALAFLSQHGKEALVLAGGTDLVVMIREGAEHPKLLVDIKGLPELQMLELKNKKLTIGARITFTDLLDSSVVRQKFPILWESAKTVASVGIRNRATLVGNICSAVPCMDSAPALFVYDAEILAKNVNEERMIPVGKWFVAPHKTALQPGEFVTGVILKLPPKKHAGCYVKLERTAEDLAQVGLAVLVNEDRHYKLSYCAVSPVPVRAGKIEQLLHGKDIADDLIAKAKELVKEEISPISDVRASKEYRLHMAEIMLERGLKASVARLSGKGPEYGANLL